MYRLFYDAQPFADFFKFFKGEFDLAIGQARAHLKPKPRGAFGHDGIAEAGDENAFFQQRLAHADGKGGLAEDDRDEQRGFFRTQ